MEARRDASALQPLVGRIPDPRALTPDPRPSIPDPRAPTPVVSVIVPTYNERDSLPHLVARLTNVAARLPMEIVIVDDGSPDGTGELAEELAKTSSVPITVVHRAAKQGLASAVIAGAIAARSDIVSVMDADLSHPPELLSTLAEAVRSRADVAIASRYVRGGGVERWTLPRRLVSRIATWLARTALGLRVRDPLSGFFAVRRGILIDHSYAGLGYKLLVEVLTEHREKRAVEIPYRFVDRQRGASKLDGREILAFVRLVWQLRRAVKPGLARSV